MGQRRGHQRLIEDGGEAADHHHDDRDQITLRHGIRLRYGGIGYVRLHAYLARLGGGAADLGCCCQTAAAAVRRHSSCGDSRKNNETAYCLSSLWTTRLLPLPPKVQTHLMPSRAAVTGTADALVPVPETLIEADQGFLARQHQAVSPGIARVFDDGAHEAARPPPPAESIRIRALPAHPDRSYRRVVSSAWLHCNSSLP